MKFKGIEHLKEQLEIDEELMQRLKEKNDVVCKKAAALSNMLALLGVGEYPDNLCETARCDISQVFDCLFDLCDTIYDKASELDLALWQASSRERDFN